MDPLLEKLQPFKYIWTGPLPTDSQLSSLTAPQLKSLKLRRDYDNLVKSLGFADLVLCLQYEAEEISKEVFPEFTFRVLLLRIRGDEEIMMLAESGLVQCSDVKLHLFEYLASVTEINKVNFMLLTFVMEQLTSEISEIKFLNNATTDKIKSGAIPQAIAQAWIKVLSLVDSDESLKQQILRIFLLEVLEKLGDHAKICLDPFMNIAKRSKRPSRLLAISCMLHLLIKFENIEHPRIYKDVFDALGNMDLLDESTDVTLAFLSSVETLAKSTHLANFMLTKIIRALAMLAVRSGRSEVSSKILDILATQKRVNPTCRAWTELQVDTDFKYNCRNEWKEGGIGSIHPELATLRYHIEPDIVLDTGKVLRGELIDQTGILVDFDEINPQKVEVLHTKENRAEPKVLKS